MPIYRRGETWWVGITHHGRRIRQSAGTTDKAEAQRIHDQLKAHLWNQVAAGATLNDALKLWLQTAPRNKRELNAIAQFRSLYRNRPIAEITGADIINTLSGRSAATINRTTNIIRAALNLAQQRGLTDSAPHIQRLKVRPSRLRWLTQTEWRAVYTELAEHLKPIALFAVSTGLRQANVLKLKWRQIDLDRRVCWVDGADAKGGKSLGVPLSDAAVQALESVRGQHPEWVFTVCKAGGNRTTISSPKTGWNAAVIRAGIQHATWHDLRHTWASWHVQRGTPLGILQKLGGWAGLDMVMVYAHLAPEHLTPWANNAALEPESGVSEIVTGHRRL